jgi:FkbM family methyltransferase
VIIECIKAAMAATRVLRCAAFVGAFSRGLNRLLEASTGCRIYRPGPRAFCLIDREHYALRSLGAHSFTVMAHEDLGDAWFSQYDQLADVLARLRVDLVLDVGANEGQFARELRTFYKGPLVSIEPASQPFAVLQAASAGDAEWRTVRTALGRAQTTAQLNVAGVTAFSSLLRVRDATLHRYPAAASTVQRETVTVRRLDSLLDEICGDAGAMRIFLKMDTQGYDLEVFAGLGRWLDRIVGLQSEVSLRPLYDDMPHWIESLSTYEQAGFSVVGMFPVVRIDGSVIEYDCLLAKA